MLYNLALLALSASALLFAVTYALLVLLSPSTKRATVASEQQYLCASSPTTLKALPSIDDPPKVSLSVVVPAYNESLRLETMLQAAVNHLRGIPSRKSEIIIVDDCSSDATSQVALTLAAKFSDVDIRIVKLTRNRKKGGAVQHGVLHSRGERILMVDADGASKFEDLEALWKQLDSTEKDGHGVAVGSRAHMVHTAAVVKRSVLRNICMHGFHFLLRTVGVGYIQDTQCGFKLFTRDSASILFKSLHILGWIFDVELLLLAQQLKIPVVEVPVDWHEVDGSKLNVARDSIIMLRDVLVLRGNYMIGRWRSLPTIKTKKS